MNTFFDALITLLCCAAALAFQAALGWLLHCLDQRLKSKAQRNIEQTAKANYLAQRFNRHGSSTRH